MTARQVDAARWPDAVAELSFEDSDLLVEKLDAGSSNYVMAIGAGGQTWSAALRIPAPGADLNDFIEDKSSSLPVLRRLVEILGEPVKVNDHCDVVFGGASLWVDNPSTKAFLDRQSTRAHSIRDAVTGTEKHLNAVNFTDDDPEARTADEQAAIRYIDEYQGPVFMSRGAPASETVEDFPNRALDVAAALGVIHATARRDDSQPDVRPMVTAARSMATDAAALWSPSRGSKERRALDRMLSKSWGESPEAARREAWLRSPAGRAEIRSLVRTLNPSPPTRDGFVHGDAHGANFIIVDYLYSTEERVRTLDREFLNGCFERSPDSDRLALHESKDGILVSDRIEGAFAQIARDPHFEVHPIDFDDATFTGPDPQSLDAVTLVLSCENIFAAEGSGLKGDMVIEAYLSGLDG